MKQLAVGMVVLALAGCAMNARQAVLFSPAQGQDPAQHEKDAKDCEAQADASLETSQDKSRWVDWLLAIAGVGVAVGGAMTGMPDVLVGLTAADGGISALTAGGNAYSDRQRYSDSYQGCMVRRGYTLPER